MTEDAQRKLARALELLGDRWSGLDSDVRAACRAAADALSEVSGQVCPQCGCVCGGCIHALPDEQSGHTRACRDARARRPKED